MQVHCHNLVHLQVCATCTYSGAGAVDTRQAETLQAAEWYRLAVLEAADAGGCTVSGMDFSGHHQFSNTAGHGLGWQEALGLCGSMPMQVCVAAAVLQ
jgi:hypothetical protein